MKSRLVMGSRGSELALWQTNHIADRLKAVFSDLEVRVEVFSTKGDKELDKPLPEIGGKGVFTAELEAALREKRIDLAVHSLKDLPTEDAEGLVIGAVSDRATPNDALVCASWKSLNDLPQGARVGTSSLRRRAQLLARRPDLQIVDIRGNVQTRVKRTQDGTCEAIVLATAGLERVGMTSVIAQILAPHVMLPAAAQGALAVQARADDREVLDMLAQINDPLTEALTTAERRLLHALGGGCHVPLGVLAVEENGTVQLNARVCSLDGRRIVETEMEGNLQDAATLGDQAALYLLSNGAAEIIAELEQSTR